MSGKPSRFDLIVIGGGINGAAIAREAALRGLTVLMLEASDIASGTTAASTRLIHGGLRYLEYAELGLVYESLAERERLLRTAPHLVAPLELCLPVYARGKRPKWQIHVGLALYDLLSLRKSTPRHSMLSRAAVLERLPGLDPEGLLGGARYFDGQVTYPERLVVELVTDAVANGAELMTYTEACEILVSDGRVAGVRWHRADGRAGTSYSDAVVNAAGPWVDRVNAGLTIPRRIGGTRGSHLISEPLPGVPNVGIYTEARSDGRPFFILPWNGLCLIGTTDSRYEGDPSEVSMSDAELDYLVSETEQLFPNLVDLPRKILYTCAGVRPLPYQEKGAEAAITRRHLIRHERAARGLYSVIGGKLTTHRALAEDVLRKIRKRNKSIPAGSRTRERALPGAMAPADRDDLLRRLESAVSVTAAERLVNVYGAQAERLLDSIERTPELGSPLGTDRQPLVAELVNAIENEWATHLVDILQRRSMTGLGPDFGVLAAAPASEWLVKLGIWEPTRAESELAAYREHARRFRARALLSDQR